MRRMKDEKYQLLNKDQNTQLEKNIEEVKLCILENSLEKKYYMEVETYSTN